MTGRLDAMVKKCKNRGGDCSCRYGCQALEEVSQEIMFTAVKFMEIQNDLDQLKAIKKRLTSPMATLKPDFSFKEGLKPVIVFDADEAFFVYEDANGNINEQPWPFNEDFVWFDDCERLGFSVEFA